MFFVSSTITTMAALQNTLHVSEYSPDGKWFALINSEGKLKIWDAETSELKQEYVPKLHLNVPLTCFTWITVDNAVKSKKKKEKVTKTSALYIALGTKSGGVSLFSFATAEIESNLKGNGHEGDVTAICRDGNNNLYTCGVDRQVVVWSLATGTQTSSETIGSEKPTSLVHLPQLNRLAIGGRHLLVWSIERQEVEHTFIGHTKDITLLKYVKLNDQEFVLSASKADRILNLWRVEKSPKSQEAQFNYLMEDAAFGLNCITDPAGGYILAAVTRSGVLHVYSGTLVRNEKKVAKTIKPTITIEVASDSTQIVEPIPVVSASLELCVHGKEVHFGYGSHQVLRFETIELDLNEKRQVLVRNDPKRINVKASNKDKSLVLKSVTPVVDGKVEYQTTVTATKRTLKSTELPMQTRLENLSVDSGAKHGRNIAQLLIQALHSRNDTLLQTVFTNKDDDVIRSTLKRLPPQYVGSLVSELTALAQKKTTHVQTATVWMRVLLQTHTSQLMAIGTTELFSTFGPLLGIIEHRAHSLQPLLKLSGRLDLLVSQIKLNSEEDFYESENLLVYEDKDTDDEEEFPIENGQESSDEQWEEDDSEDEEKMSVDEADED